MEKVNVICNWDLPINFYFEKKIELYVNQTPKTIKPDDVIRFVVIFEPPEIDDVTNDVLDSYQKKLFDYLLTHQDNLLQLIPNSYMFEFGTCWIKNYSFPLKNFSVSTLVGGKKITEGHLLRHNVWSNEDKIINIPTNFFNSSNYKNNLINYDTKPKIGNDKSPLFDSQYHICIENTKRNNWFTEKLIDCLQTKTIPIYYGCPNIGNWFDTRGMLFVDNLNDIIETCNKLTPDYYDQMIPYIENNYEQSKEFIDINYRLIKTIKNIVNKKQ